MARVMLGLGFSGRRPWEW